MYMVSVNQNINNNYPYVNNSSSVVQQPTKVENTSPADKYIEKLNKKNVYEAEGPWGQRKSKLSLSSVMPFCLSVCYGITAALIKNIGPKHFYGAMTLGLLASVGSHLYVNSDKNKQNYFKKFEDTFNKMNTDTDAVLSDKTFFNEDIGAIYNPISGRIQPSTDCVKDPISAMSIKKHIKRQLVHAKQYEIVARSKDGISKINYAVVNSFAKEINKNSRKKQKFNEVYQDVLKNPLKYQNKKINLAANGAEVNFMQYVFAINTLLNNPNAGIKDIPIIIDEKHYQNVINKKGALKPEEELKADEYYKAMLELKQPSTPLERYFPYSSYRKNLLVKEAYETK